jgi:hypothetical protein
MRLRPHSAVLLILALAAVVLTACGGSSSSKTTTTSAVNISNSGGKVCSYRFAVITHGDNGSFCSRVRRSLTTTPRTRRSPTPSMPMSTASRFPTTIPR